MLEKNTYTLRIQYDKKTSFKAMVDDNNNWKSLDVHSSRARRARVERILEELKEVGEKLGPQMTGPSFPWYPARFAFAAIDRFPGTKLLNFTGEPFPKAIIEPGLVY